MWLWYVQKPEVLDLLSRSVLLQQQPLQQLFAGQVAAAAQQVEQQFLKAGQQMPCPVQFAD